MSALSAFKILELSEGVAGEYCGKLLADFGADVIKIEKPDGGSPTRRMGPFSAKGAAPEHSGLFAYLNTNKSSVTLDIATGAGAETLRKLLSRVDVVIDDHPPGWLKSIGLDPESFQAAYPQLVLCSITAYGQEPPEDRMHAEDLNVFHASGWGFHTPGGADGTAPPLNGPGRFMPSYEAGIDAALCVTACLYERDSSGQGQFIDIAKQAVLTSRIDYVLGQMVAGDMDVTQARTGLDLFGPAGIFPTRDGFAYIWMSTQGHWEALRDVLGDPDWMRAFPARWMELDCTPERVELCQHQLGEWLKREFKHVVAEKAQKAGLILVPVNTAEDLQASPQYQHRKFFAEAEHPVLGRIAYPTTPYKMSATPASIRTAAPLLGRDTDAKLADVTGGKAQS